MTYKHYSVDDFLTDENFLNYCRGTGSPGFRNQVLANDPELKDIFDQAEHWFHLLNGKQGNLSEAFQNFNRKLSIASGSAAPVRKIARYFWIAGAAVILLAIFSFLFIQIRESSTMSAEMLEQRGEDKKPGRDQATLQLADGRLIVLDSGTAASQFIQGGVNIIGEDGQISYQPSGDSQQGEFLNTLSTPRGGHYKIQLGDGTKVWLNAQSVLRFPAAFNVSARNVELSGEAYFEVAKDRSRPFVVKLISDTHGADNEIHVLGTHFNINAYENEQELKATVAEGLISLRSSKEEIKVAVGEQAVGSASGSLKLEKNADLESALAWKNGRFQFGEAMDIESVMKQLSRWYDIDIIYEEPVTEKIGGGISRNVNISQVLEMLAMTGAVAFEIRGNAVIVKKGR